MLHFMFSQRLLYIIRWLKSDNVSGPVCPLFHTRFLLSSHLNPEDGGDIYLWNLCGLIQNYDALKPRATHSSVRIVGVSAKIRTGFLPHMSEALSVIALLSNIIMMMQAMIVVRGGYCSCPVCLSTLISQ
jgi:hypothetical protein